MLMVWAVVALDGKHRILWYVVSALACVGD